ncbi:Armadillo repeat-containing protein 8 [Sarcoptes scabiei]|nr:Armadillo repeat-containing protein 8 [Sarcoptes scabiei]
MMLMNANQICLDELYSNDSSICLPAVRRVKNSVIGSNRLKGSVLEQNVAQRLVELMKFYDEQIRIEATLTITSLAKGTDQHLKMIIDSGAIKQLIENVQSENVDLIEASLRGLRTIYRSRLAPVDLIYEPSKTENNQENLNVPIGDKYPLLYKLFKLASQTSKKYIVKECIANIMASTCQSSEHQNILKEMGAIHMIATFIHPDCKNAYQIKLAALNLLARICFENERVSTIVATRSFPSQTIVEMLFQMMSADNTFEMQLTAAKCMVYIYRSNAIDSKDTRLIYRALPTLVFLCKKDKTSSLRAQAAEELAYLIDIDVTLQKTASICNHIIESLADMLRQSSSLNRNSLNVVLDSSRKSSVSTDIISTGVSSSNHLMALDEPMDAAISTTPPLSFSNFNPNHSTTNAEEDINVKNELRQAAFKVFASLGANDEEIRKRIIETENLMEEVMISLEDSDVKVKLAALRCLHSLSRSVQQLRTLFQDHSVWIPLRNLLQSSTYEIIMLASSVLCNLLLDFSPSKQHFLDHFSIELLCNLTKRDDVQLRLNGVWALMNMAYQADESLKTEILTNLGTDQMFRLLSDSNVNILMKTLGLLRNLLSTKPHIDSIMQLHGKQIMPAVILILEGEHSWEVKEQALCILVNIADGIKAKEFIMSNEDVLKKLTSYLLNSNVNLQISAIFCIINLIWTENEGAEARQEKLKELSVPKILQQMLTQQSQQQQVSAVHAPLYEKVKTALQQFNSCK